MIRLEPLDAETWEFLRARHVLVQIRDESIVLFWLC
jgi:hypothetical protein